MFKRVLCTVLHSINRHFVENASERFKPLTVLFFLQLWIPRSQLLVASKGGTGSEGNTLNTRSDDYKCLLYVRDFEIFEALLLQPTTSKFIFSTLVITTGS